ncbi:MAG: 2-C-methyl-D-erythritol 4-phosphate cytidylyltransferase [Candidatus Tectomicrobia bacterium RIFCSPLOWO2_12_FULL_69_37]|nr:MAG: 2-C-methyl-D-erythritol 4-phosphate cytidylyltransferase [Candidatus Tectomicrobia bacterium RIFCSPLOWO2_02_FULL_70_19]OGL58893.1 MAG: 2-C-methyl-D-erythritol 4-phosphate cytidylyltransferase [Candidatus Tectomicrobia bacterium RIFCSPLOWO2_12_FULL_69_37]
MATESSPGPRREETLPPPSRVGAVVPAAGRGARLPGAVPKQFRPLGGLPLLWHPLYRLARSGAVGSIVLVLPPGSLGALGLPKDLGLSVQVTEGGARRQDSVERGLFALPPEVEWAVVHDGARPLLPPALVRACLEGALETGASLAALPVSDTVKRGGPGGFAEGTVPRDGLWLAQTPQVARRELLEKALRAARDEGREGTDEAALLEAIGVRVRLVPGDPMNLKVTRPEDLALAEAYLALSKEGGGA